MAGIKVSRTIAASVERVWAVVEPVERHIDWMALNGINIPLAFTGQEEIWRRVYSKVCNWL